MTATSCELQPCRRSNVRKTWLVGLLQPLPGDFRSNDVTSESLQVTSGHVTSFPTTWLPPPASYSPVGAQSYPKHDRPSTVTSRWLPVKWRHFRVTSGYMKSRNVISCHVTATSYELQPHRSRIVSKTWLRGLLHPLAGDFWSNDVTSGSPPVAGHVTSFSVTRQPLITSYTALYDSNVLRAWPIRFLQPLPGEFRSNDVTSGNFRARKVTSRHFLSHDCHLLRVKLCSSSNVPKTWLIGVLQSLPVYFRSNDVTSGSLPVSWSHVMSFPVTWLPPPASYRPIGAETYPKLDL